MTNSEDVSFLTTMNRQQRRELRKLGRVSHTDRRRLNAHLSRRIADAKRKAYRYGNPVTRESKLIESMPSWYLVTLERS